MAYWRKVLRQEPKKRSVNGVELIALSVKTNWRVGFDYTNDALSANEGELT
jgi:hypothetical protein